MVSVAINEGLLLIASVIITAGITAAVFTQTGFLRSAFSMSTETQKEIALTKIQTLYASNSSSTVVNVWTKNIGTYPITGLSNVDVYFGQLGSAQRIPYNSTSSAPKWVYDGSTPITTIWPTQTTIQIDITTSSSLVKNVPYDIRITTPNGVSSDYIFSIS